MAQHRPSPDELEELLEHAAEQAHAAPLDLALDGVDRGADLVIAEDAAGDVLLLTADELELLSRTVEPGPAGAGDGSAEEEEEARVAWLTRRALERIGRFRVRRVVELAARPEDATPEQAAEQAWRLLTSALAGGALMPNGPGVGLDLAAYVRAYLDLRTHAGNTRRSRDLDSELMRLAGAAGHVIDEAKDLGADTFEGRLEELGHRLNRLGEVLA